MGNTIIIDQSTDCRFFDSNPELVSSQNNSPSDDAFTGIKRHHRGYPSTTDTVDINHINRMHLEYLIQNQPYFLNMLAHTTFEDGCYNDASDYVQESLKINESATCNWLNILFDQYREDEDVTSGILSIIALLCIDPMYLGSLMNIISSAMSSNNPDLQASAIHVMENIRNLSCLKILRTNKSQYPWIEYYANKVMTELEKELNINVA